MRRLTLHSWFPRLFAGLLVLAMLPWLGIALLTAQDSTTVVDKTGIFGPIIDSLFPVVVTFLTSLAVKIVAAANDGFVKTSPVVKYIALYLFALGFNYLAGFLGITAVDPLAPVLTLSLVQTVAAAAVYRFGSHTVPTSAFSRPI
jgi:hypothetical protein